MQLLSKGWIWFLGPIFLSSYSFSDPPNWTVNPSDYEFTASMTGVLIFNDVESFDSQDIIAAFDGEECRGVKTNGIVYPPTDRVVFGITLYGNGSGEIISFKAYDASTDHIFDSTDFTYTFLPNDIVGGADEPLEWIFNDTNLGVDTELLPNGISLYPIYPNPFNAIASVRFTVEVDRNLVLKVYDVEGRLVKILLNEHLKKGNHSVQWNADGFSSGVYIVLLEGGRQRIVQKMMLIK